MHDGDLRGYQCVLNCTVLNAYCNSSVSLSVVDCSRWSIWEDSEDVLISASLPALAVSL